MVRQGFLFILENNMSKPREIIVERLKKDLLGPFNGDEEVISNSLDDPDKEYFSGKIYPQNEEPNEDVIEEFLEENAGKEITNSHHEETSGPKSRISSCGLTFYINSPNKNIQLSLLYNFGKYFYDSDQKSWSRKKFKNNPVNALFLIENVDGEGQIDELADKESGISFHYKARRNAMNDLCISIFAVNDNRVMDDDSYVSKQEKIFFQFEFKVICSSKDIIPLPTSVNSLHDDAINSFLYRNKKTYSTGHSCSSSWSSVDNNIIISTEWFPMHFVPDMSSDGNKSIKDLSFNAKELSSSTDKEIITLLKNLVKKYKEWVIKEQGYQLKKDHNLKIFSEVLKNQANIGLKHIQRMNDAIKLFEKNKNAIHAFRLANEALSMQYRWSQIELEWRPFQIGFLLLSLESTLIKNSVNRDEVDLLWFPTGGGKTEAYLFLTSVLLFFRKLEMGSLNEKDGLAVISRYTMRALTNDQFIRMTSTILACEYVRRKKLKFKNIEPKESSSFSIGMWVGEAATPNKISDLSEKNPNQRFNIKKLEVIKVCPCCKQELIWYEKNRSNDFRPIVFNEKKDCKLSNEIKYLPIYVVDEQIYQNPPSAIVGTIDKFVQVIKKPFEARSLFSVDTSTRSLDLIIQDELHLISGPLGSISGLIEILIEEYSTDSNGLPKIVGSTATIQRAEDQIKSLYFKNSLQFPINISSIDDSFFSNTEKDSPGRLYLGITSGSSTSTHMMQAICGILLQSLKSKDLEGFDLKEIDPYSTIVAYYNTIRVLSGSKVSLQDTTSTTIDAFAEKYGESKFIYDAPEELTSSNTQEELRDIMTRLAKDYSHEDYISIVLASVMISVGLDISRLGLMVVDGQPKSIAEYIQATSRVGRGKIPGLVITLFNNYKARDKSYFETFQNWHESLYRFVESTGVTPFSARARQKIFPALLVSLSLKKLNRTEGNFAISKDDRIFIEKTVKPILLEKIKFLDPIELKDAELEIDEIIKKWFNRGDQIQYLNNDKDELNSLLISAETSATKKAVDIEGDIAFITPNSAREVEPSVNIKALRSFKFLR